MKLLYITNGITGAGGLERVLSIKASELADNYRYEVHLLSLNEIDKRPFFSFSDRLILHSIEVSGNSLSYFSSYKRGIQQLVNKIEPHIILVCDDGLKGFLLPTLIKTPAKWIYERHVSKLIESSFAQSFPKSMITRIKWLLMEKLGQNFSKFVVLTEGNKNEWQSLLNLEVIPNPLSFYPLQSSFLDQKTLICVGKISYQKGQDLLVKAWEMIRKKHPEWRLELYGNANESFLDTHSLEQLNIFHFPAVKDILDKYLESSIYVMSSRFEGFGMVLIEAMACGVPCVSFNCNYGPSDIIKNNEDGFLAENGNIFDLANQIITLMDDVDLRKAMGEKARENVKRFDPQIIAGQWDILFKKLLNKTL